MPLTVITYECVKCRRAFNSYDEARECEKSHPRLLSAKTVRYTVRPYPYSIEVGFSDGEKRIYNSQELGG
jgi:hypothetical protein